MIRRLGFTEAFFTEVQARGAGAFLVVGCFGFRGRLAPETLKRTLAALHRHYPLLRATVSRDVEGFPVFVETVSFADVPVRIVDGEAVDHWADVFDTEFDRPLDHGRALWRATLLHPHEDGARSWLLVAMDHAITDGLSWVAFASAFDRVHAAVAAGRPVEAVPLAVKPPVEPLLASSGYRKGALSMPAANGDAWPHAEPTPLSDRRTRFLHVWLPKAETTDLVARCHAHSVTVNDALMAAYAKAIADLDPAPKRFVMTIPHNIRDSVRPPISHEDMGAFVVEIPVVCDRPKCLDVEFWTLAADLDRKVHAALPASMKADPDYDMAGLRQAVDETIDPARAQFTKAVLSNLGVPEISRGPDGLAVDRLYIGVSMHAGANAFFVTAATIDGALNVSLGACHSLVRPADHRAATDRFVALLKAHG